MERDRGAILEDMMGAALFKRAPVGTTEHRQGETACLTSRMDAALLGENPNAMMDEAIGNIAEIEADATQRQHRAEDHKLVEQEKALAIDNSF